MEFEKVVTANGVALKATGPIRSGDYEKMLQLLPTATLDQNGLRRLMLESPGGEVAEAMRLAELIRQNRFVTLVAAECASACAMILYTAGQYAMLLDGGKLGFHSCYDKRTSTEQPECTEAIATLAAKNGFPYGSVKVFASLAGPADMHWMSNILAHCYGFEHFIGDPAPITYSTLCPKAIQELIDGKAHQPNRPLGPSFDCKAARSEDERLLCSDSELMHLDALMGQLYRMIRQRKGARASAFVSAQRRWIRDRNEKCGVMGRGEQSRADVQCFAEATMARMRELLEENGTPVQNLAPLIERLGNVH
jgi:uncharacterized protein YecT (DUF1311 family)